MPTLTVVEGFEYGFPASGFPTAGGGIANLVGRIAGVSCDSSVKRSGAYSLKIVQDTASATSMRKGLSTGVDLWVVSVYFRVAAPPSVLGNMIMFEGPTNAPLFRIEATTGLLSGLVGTTSTQSTASSVCDDAWHRLDIRVDTTNTTYTMDWQVDGVAQTQVSRASQTAGSDITSIRFGSGTAGHGLTFWADDLVMSVTTGDYPIGEHTVFAVMPSSDGTHVAGTNTMEDNAGTDITTSAFELVNNQPPDTAVYLRQATIGTSNYAEVNFANHDATMTTIWDAQVHVGYTSSTNAVNEGGTIISYDGFSTSIEVYGTPAARTNYQSGATTTITYKCQNTSLSDGVITRPAGGWTTSYLDALQGRMGYSNDITGNPRWHMLLVQYAGTLGGGGGGGGETSFAGNIPI